MEVTVPDFRHSDFDPSHELLDSANDHDIAPTFEACLNAHGMYETMRFVLRLSPRNHELMEMIEANDFGPGPPPPEAIQAYSTYIHETIHWWQHVGSTSGLLFSMSYLAQVHSSIEELRDVVATFGPKKPLKGWTDQVLVAEGWDAQAKLGPANIAVNNALDVEYYKAYAYEPRKNIHWMIEENHFESVGHMYFIVYGHLAGMIESLIGEDEAKLSGFAGWNKEISRLNDQQVDGYYWRSPVHLPAVGMRAIYEGQARFVQLQFLDGGRKSPLTCAEWREQGYLSGIYVEAFDAFLKLSASEWPENLADPLVALFLLICDLAINPTRGVPLEIESFEDFILDVDVGVRFTRLCSAVKDLPHLKQTIRDYSKDEYVAVSTELTLMTGYDHPLTGCLAVRNWLETSPGIQTLMQEHRTFEFEHSNLPVRVFVSHFIAFYTDKCDHPEFFCWPGVHMSAGGQVAEFRAIWLRHLSLFSDRGDKRGVYPRRWPDRSEAAVKQMFERFYGTMALYDLTRQWILKDGPFVCDFRWISENYSQAHAEAWANDTMKQAYNVTLEDFEIVQ